MKQSAKETGIIAPGGMGGFLCPPTHPMHTHHVETDLRRRRENRGSMSLEYAVDCEYLTDSARAGAKALLDNWQRPALSEVREWVLQVLGYFAGCYNLRLAVEWGWEVAHLTMDKTLDPMTYADNHAGVHLIRKYYPDYQPTKEDFEQAHWGTR